MPPLNGEAHNGRAGLRRTGSIVTPLVGLSSWCRTADIRTDAPRPGTESPPPRDFSALLVVPQRVAGPTVSSTGARCRGPPQISRTSPMDALVTALFSHESRPCHRFMSPWACCHVSTAGWHRCHPAIGEIGRRVGTGSTRRPGDIFVHAPRSTNCHGLASGWKSRLPDSLVTAGHLERNRAARSTSAFAPASPPAAFGPRCSAPLDSRDPELDARVRSLTV